MSIFSKLFKFVFMVFMYLDTLQHLVFVSIEMACFNHVLKNHRLNYSTYNDWTMEDMRSKHGRVVKHIEFHELDFIAMNDVFEADRKNEIEELFTSNKYDFVWAETHISKDEEEDEQVYRNNGFAIHKDSAWKVSSVDEYWLKKTPEGKFQLDFEDSDDAGKSVLYVQLENRIGDIQKNIFVTHCCFLQAAFDAVNDFSKDFKNDTIICGDLNDFKYPSPTR